MTKKYYVNVGDRFGTLAVVRLIPGSEGIHCRAHCFCDCGKEHIAEIRQLIKGSAVRCRSCAGKLANIGRSVLPEIELHFRRREQVYRASAKKRNNEWGISREKFREFLQGECHYCGKTPANGIDRRNNGVGYIPDNSVSCCKVCNLAKNNMTEQEFLVWVARIAAKQGFSL